jgi:hypothetical protein
MTLQQLKELAGKATKGPWFYDSYSKVFSSESYAREDDDFYICQTPCTSGDTATEKGAKNAAYIAALSPEVVLALVNAVEALKLTTEYGDIHGAPSRHATKILGALDAALGGEK